ncbi:hypothetical protein D3C73_1210260 [compost metagenome]
MDLQLRQFFQIAKHILGADIRHDIPAAAQHDIVAGLRRLAVIAVEQILTDQNGGRLDFLDGPEHRIQQRNRQHMPDVDSKAVNPIGVQLETGGFDQQLP